MHDTQAFVICGVTETAYGYDLRLGPGEHDPWVSIGAADFPTPPQVGDIAIVTLPKVERIVPRRTREDGP